jgi:hypothetical protein
MPRLVKGGKYIYGLSLIGPEGSIAIPPEAMREYGFSSGDNIILMSGSHSSGGFAITRQDIIEKSELAGVISSVADVFNHTIAECEVVEHKGRSFCWTTISDGNNITLSPDALLKYGVNAGDILAVGRGSRLAIAFIARGPIMEECLKHPELNVFQANQE